MSRYAGRTQYMTREPEIYNKHTQIDATTGALWGGSGFTVEFLRKHFGGLFVDEFRAPSLALDEMEYRQSLSMNYAYKDRAVPMFSSFITASIMNAKNLFLLSVVAPIFETADIHFTVTRKEWNQIAFEETPEGGITNEPTFSTWQWRDTMLRYSKSQTLSVDLTHDENYGMETFMENLAVLASDATLRLYQTVAMSLMAVGYENMVQDRTKQIPFDISQLFAAETLAFFAFAKDPAQGLNLILKEKRTMPGLDMAIFPENGARAMVGLPGGLRRSVPARRLVMNPDTRRLEAELEPGPQSIVSFPIGDAQIDVMELTSFRVNSLDDRVENPLQAKLTLCQFFPPDEDIRADDVIKHTDGRLLDMWIFHQTKEKGEEERISFRKMLRHCFYFDPVTGKRSRWLADYIRHLNARHNNHGEDLAPYQWSRDGKEADDINDDKGDYERPDARWGRLIGQSELLHMKAVRHKFCGVVYDPQLRKYRDAVRVGDNHLDTLPNEWVMRAVRVLQRQFELEMGSCCDDGFSHLFSLLESMKKSPVDEDYVKALIEANMNALMPGGQMTPASENGVEEFVANEYGSLRLPKNLSNELTGLRYPPGFHSGPGLLTLADEALDPASPFLDAATEARKAVEFVRRLVRFLKAHLGDTDLVDAKYAAPWFRASGGKNDEAMEIAVMIDALYDPHGQVPVFLGVPARGSQGVESVEQTGRPSLALQDVVLQAGDVSTIQPVELLEEGYVDDSLQAVAVLSPPIANKWKGAMIRLGSGWATRVSADERRSYAVYTEVARELFAQLIETGDYAGTKDATQAAEQRRVANALTDHVMLMLYPAGPPQNGFEYFAGGAEDAARNADKAKAFLKKLRTHSKQALAELAKTKAYEESASSGLAEKLRSREKQAFVRSTPVGRTSQDRLEIGNRGAARRRDRNVTFFEGDFGLAPQAYLRSPLMYSPALGELIQAGFRWALPGDWASRFTTPDLAAGSGRPAMPDFGRLHFDRLAGMRSLFGCHHTARHDDEYEEEYGYGDRMPKSHHRELQSRAFDLGDRLRDDLRFPPAPHAAPRKEADRSQDEAVGGREYYGPWRARIAFADAELKGRPLAHLLYMALLQTQNELGVHERLGALGAPLMNVVLFRPFIQLMASSVVVMHAGEETIATPLSRVDATLTKEARGFFHITASLYTGSIRLKPENIRLIPYSLPARFISGKTCDFMTDPGDWEPANPLQPSIIALPTPVSERTYAPQIHMCAKELIPRRDIDGPSFRSKISTFDWFEFLFDKNNVESIDALHYDRHNYHCSVPVSLVARRGPCRFLNQQTLEPRDVEGFGPGNSLRENIAGAQYVWNGAEALFPAVIPSTKTLARGQ